MMIWKNRLSVGTLVLLGYGTGLVAAFTGQTTWYNVNQHNAPGACGNMHYDNEFVVAIAHGSFDTYPGATPNPNNNPICGKNIKATYQGKSVVVTIVDRCHDCEIPTNIDMSPTAFSILADQSVGRIYGVEWDYTDEPAGPANGGGGTATTNPSPASPEAQLQVKRDGAGAGIGSLVKLLRRRSTTHQGTDEPVSRDLSSAGTPVPGENVGRRGESPDEPGVAARSAESTSATAMGYKRRFNLPDPVRLRRFHEAIEERDRMSGRGDHEKKQERPSSVTVTPSKRSSIADAMRLRRRFSEAIQKREWLRQDR